MAEQSREAVHAAQIDADAQIAAMRQDAAAQVNEFRSTYPTRLQFPYALDDKAGRWPFLVQGMWHDGQFTYVDPPPRKRPRSTNTATASRPSSRTTSSKTDSLLCAGLSGPAGCRSAATAPAGKSTLTIWTNPDAKLDPTQRPRSRRIFSHVDHADRAIVFALILGGAFLVQSCFSTVPTDPDSLTRGRGESPAIAPPRNLARACKTLSNASC